MIKKLLVIVLPELYCNDSSAGAGEDRDFTYAPDADHETIVNALPHTLSFLNHERSYVGTLN
jgi:hypothetical protein